MMVETTEEEMKTEKLEPDAVNTHGPSQLGNNYVRQMLCHRVNNESPYRRRRRRFLGMNLKRWQQVEVGNLKSSKKIDSTNLLMSRPMSRCCVSTFVESAEGALTASNRPQQQQV